MGRERPNRDVAAPAVDIWEQVSEEFMTQVETREEDGGWCSVSFIRSVFVVFSKDDERDTELLVVDDRRHEGVIVEERLVG